MEKVPADKHDYSADLVTGGIGLVGALVGAWVGAKVTATITRKQKSDEERERDDVAMHSVFRAINSVYTFTTGFVNDADAAIKLHESGDVQFISAALQPYGNYPHHLSISADEIYRAKRVGGYMFSNMIIDMDTRFNSLIESQITYRTLRGAALTMLKVDAVDGRAVTGSADKEKEPHIRAEFVNLDAMTTQSRDIADELRRDAYHAIVKCVESIAEYFMRPQKMELRDLDGKFQNLEFKPAPRR